LSEGKQAGEWENFLNFPAFENLSCYVFASPSISSHSILNKYAFSLEALDSVSILIQKNDFQYAQKLVFPHFFAIVWFDSSFSAQYRLALHLRAAKWVIVNKLSDGVES
jgi:hypothetical protein